MMNTKTYEGMFLVDAGNPDFDASSAPVRTVLERSEAEVLSMKAWDERRLAYEIKGRKRALYVLAYFRLDPLKVAELERDVELNEGVLRALILRRDNLTDEVINAATPAEMAPAEDAEEGADGEDAAADADASEE
jgi:small subunit ribosomal protein S6